MMSSRREFFKKLINPKDLAKMFGEMYSVKEKTEQLLFRSFIEPIRKEILLSLYHLEPQKESTESIIDTIKEELGTTLEDFLKEYKGHLNLEKEKN